MTGDWSIVWELALLAIGGAALWLYVGLGWHRLHRAPRRRQLFMPVVGGALLIAMIIAGQAGVMIAARAFDIEIPPPDGPSLSLPDLARITLGMYAAQAVVLLAYIHLLTRARRPLNDNRMKPGAAMAVGAAALLLFWPMVQVVGWIASRVVMMITGDPVDPLSHDTLVMIVAGEPDAWSLLMIVLVVLAAPILEEVLYRGILQETLGQLGLGNWTAIFVTSAIFAVMHAMVVPPQALVSLFVLSLGFGWAYEKTGRLAAPIVMHMLFNAGNIVLAMAMH